MNIFVLDNDIKKCAVYHNDKHVVKMILESVQMLSTACRLSGLNQGYKVTHVNHPCNVWVRESLANWYWLRSLVCCLNIEYRYRYKHKLNHKSFEAMNRLSVPDIPDKGMTPFVQAMPEEYKQEDAVKAYRAYYIGEKQHIAVWTGRCRPHWYTVTQ